MSSQYNSGTDQDLSPVLLFGFDLYVFVILDTPTTGLIVVFLQLHLPKISAKRG